MTDPEGARQELADLWQSQYEKLLSQCLYWTGGRRDLAEEALARSTAKALEKYPEHARAIRHPAAWLRQIAYHACVDLHRELQRRGEDDLEGLEERVTGLSARVGLAPDPEQALLRREGRGALHAGIRCLPDRLRRPLELFVDHELSYREIADALAITEANVRKRMQHAREALRPYLERYRDGSPGVRPGSGPDPPVRRAEPRAPSPPRLDPVTAIRVVSIRRSSAVWKDVALALRGPLRPATRGRFGRLETYIRTHPGGWTRRRELGRLLRQEGRWEEAVPQYAFALDKQPRQPALWAELAELQQALGRTGEALASYRHARERSRTRAERQRWKAAAMALEGHPAEAVEVLRDALALAPDRAPLLLEMARLLVRGRRFPEAEEACSGVLEELPEDAETLVLSHDARWGMGDRGGALGRLEQALARPVDNPPALVRWLVHQTLGRLRADPERVRRYRSRLCELAPDWAESRYAEALRLELTGRREGEEGRGIRRLETWLEARGRHPQGRLLLSRLQERVGAPEGASSIRRRAADADPEDRLQDWQ